MKISINTDITSEQWQRIESVSDSISFVKPRDAGNVLREIVAADVILGGVNRSLFANATRLKWVQVLSAGVDGLLFLDFVESNVILTGATGMGCGTFLLLSVREPDVL